MRDLTLMPSRNHADKLNFLASRICEDAGDGDILIFLDGDAFPVADFLSDVKQKIEGNKLTAINVMENTGQKQPSPSFCATTMGFWKEIGGDWMPGYSWKDVDGNDVTDTGGNLLKQLEDFKVDWNRMTRTNNKNLHHHIAMMIKFRNIFSRRFLSPEANFNRLFFNIEYK